MGARENMVTIEGNLTRDPELRFTQSGTAMCNLAIAVNRSWKDTNGDWQEEASFFDATAWDRLAENVADSLKKGDRVVVAGALEQRRWETDDGDKRSKVQIKAESVAASLRFATAVMTKTPKKGDDEGGGGNAAPSHADDFAASGDPF